MKLSGEELPENANPYRVLRAKLKVKAPESLERDIRSFLARDYDQVYGASREKFPEKKTKKSFQSDEEMNDKIAREAKWDAKRPSAFEDEIRLLKGEDSDLLPMSALQAYADNIDYHIDAPKGFSSVNKVPYYLMIKDALNFSGFGRGHSNAFIEMMAHYYNHILPVVSKDDFLLEYNPFQETLIIQTRDPKIIEEFLGLDEVISGMLSFPSL